MRTENGRYFDRRYPGLRSVTRVMALRVGSTLGSTAERAHANVSVNDQPRTEAAQSLTDRAIVRGRRIDDRTLSPVPKVVAAAQRPTPATSGTNLDGSRTAESAVRWEARPSATAAVVMADGPATPGNSPSAALSLREITEHVMKQIDRRMTAVRERMGR
ncbi:MAG: hypothetical protein AAFV88_04040 [Planctomycetota bacterium]